MNKYKKQIKELESKATQLEILFYSELFKRINAETKLKKMTKTKNVWRILFWILVFYFSFFLLIVLTRWIN
jgi:uncharacterized membrane protein (DUF485 family)